MTTGQTTDEPIALGAFAHKSDAASIARVFRKVAELLESGEVEIVAGGFGIDHRTGLILDRQAIDIVGSIVLQKRGG